MQGIERGFVVQILSREAYWEALDATRRPYHNQYRALYASDVDAVVLDPLLMRIPIDDHVVHRGDGAFEMFKCVHRGIYNLSAHLNRLENSLLSLGITPPVSRSRVVDIVCATLRASGLDDAAIRVYVTRGPGSFGVSPADCPQAHMYVAVSTLSPGFMEQHPDGACVGISEIPAKPGFFATMKHCNYLPNVLMKQEAIQRGLDFTIGRDAEGYLTEGPTENFGIVTAEQRLVFPRVDRVLEGTTMVRVLTLAEQLVAHGALRGIDYGRITVADLQAASEAMIVGTTTDVTHVCQFEDRFWRSIGPVTRDLRELLLRDIRHNQDMRLSIDSECSQGV